MLFREARDSRGVWRTLPLEAGWDDAEEAGIKLHMVALARDEIVLPIFAGRSGPRIVGLKATAEEIEGMRRCLPEEAVLVSEGEGKLEFADPFEVTWQLSAVSRFRSSGEMHGRWLAV